MKHVYTSRIALRWGDMDAFAHVNNTVYFRYMEQARIEWMTACGLDKFTDGTGPVLVNTHCNFLRQLRYPDQIEVKLFIGSPGRSSFETRYQICRLDENNGSIPCAEGAAKVVWVEYAAEKSVHLPDIVRAQFNGLP